MGTPWIIIAIGTSNCGNGSGSNLCNSNGTNVTAAHGRAWAQLALDFQNWLVSKKFNGYLSAAGASDMELDWETATNTRNWECVPPALGGGGCTDGYGAVSGAPLMYDYGDAAGCPPVGAAVSCDNGWTQEDVWYVAWGAPPGLPLPEIYNTLGTQATQWQKIKSYGVTAHQNSMQIKGAVTQSDACSTNPPCTGTNNTPQAGWTQMWTALNGPGSPDPNLVQQLFYSTDFTWDQQ